MSAFGRFFFLCFISYLLILAPFSCMESSHPTNATNMCRDAFLQLRDAGFRSADRRSDAFLEGKSSESRALMWLAAT